MNCKECFGTGRIEWGSNKESGWVACPECNGTGCESYDEAPTGRYLLTEDEIDTMADAIRDGDVFRAMEKIMTERIDFAMAQKNKLQIVMRWKSFISDRDWFDIPFQIEGLDKLVLKFPNGKEIEWLNWSDWSGWAHKEPGIKEGNTFVTEMGLPEFIQVLKDNV